MEEIGDFTASKEFERRISPVPRATSSKHQSSENSEPDVIHQPTQAVFRTPTHTGLKAQEPEHGDADGTRGELSSIYHQSSTEIIQFRHEDESRTHHVPSDVVVFRPELNPARTKKLSKLTTNANSATPEELKQRPQANSSPSGSSEAPKVEEEPVERLPPLKLWGKQVL